MINSCLLEPEGQCCPFPPVSLGAESGYSPWERVISLSPGARRTFSWIYDSFWSHK